MPVSFGRSQPSTKARSIPHRGAVATTRAVLEALVMLTPVVKSMLLSAMPTNPRPAMAQKSFLLSRPFGSKRRSIVHSTSPARTKRMVTKGIGGM
jgi:hypothetical protein